MKPSLPTLVSTDSDVLTGHFDRDASYRCRRPHGGRDWLLIYTHAGHGRFRNSEKSSFNHWKSIPGDVHLYPPGAPQSYETDPRHGHWELIWAHFVPPADWMPFLQWPSCWAGLHHLNLPYPADRDEAAGGLLRAVAHQESGRAHAAALTCNAFEAVLLQLDQARPRTPADATPHDPMHAVVQAMHRDLRRPWTVADLARHTPWSDSRFAHRFSEQFRVAPLAYLAELRTRRAMQLLDRTGLTVAEVAREVGYENPFYFSRRFRAVAGVSPSAYRRQAADPPH
ncbi:MAG: helix-turn-helix domain-containing protein [Planctomycetota bacterium]